jgi:CheY-like chemotaxis protein
MSPTGPWSVLVVDDDAATRRALEALLTDEGYVVLTAATGTEALALLVGMVPSVVLLDVRLPDLGGAQVLDRLAAMGRQVAVLTMSADPRPLDLSAHYPVTGHIIKPFDIDDLLQRVMGAIWAQVEQRD